MARILIVDDEVDFNEIVQRYMESAGHETVCVFNGKDAVEKVKKESFDLILMDLMMPEMDGFEAIRRIREIEKDSFIPIIILSALPESESIERGLTESGADEYIVKPCDQLALMARVRSMLRLKEKFDEAWKLNELMAELFDKVGAENLLETIQKEAERIKAALERARQLRENKCIKIKGL
ncbi:MAG: response regulator [Nitrospinae bacterium]|nr:response regulator [Nitrospinota bacterium]